MGDRPPILEFRDAEMAPPDQAENRIGGVSFSLRPGDAAVVQVEEESEFRVGQADYCPLADAAEGLLLCGPGRVFFQGRDWVAMSPMEQARNRGRIGRLFDFHGWVYNLSIRENLLLASRTYGSGLGPDEEAAAMARRFGWPGVPEGRPVLLRKREQRLFEWIRAFLFAPELVVLEKPEWDMPRAALAVGFELAREALERGAALLWITPDPEMADRLADAGATRYGVCGRQWREGRGIIP